jgi:hypothetical protein
VAVRRQAPVLVAAAVLLLVGAAAAPSGGADGRGYWVATAGGQIVPFGEVGSPGDLTPGGVPGRVVSIQATPSQQGAWLTDSNGVVYVVGDAPFYGAPSAERVADVAAFASTASGDGYWIATRGARVYAYGSSVAVPGPGPAGMELNRPIVGMSTPATGALGFWLVATDGGVFSFGDARFHGSTGNIRLNKPIVGMASTRSGQGYWLVASDGGIFAFGDAVFHGSTGDIRLNQPIVGMAPTPSGAGYWLVASDGGVFAFGDATFFGSAAAAPLPAPAVAVAGLAGG